MKTPPTNYELLPDAGSVAGCCLREGPHDGTLIEIEPTLKTLRHKSDDYHRVDAATRIVNGTRYRIYLWQHCRPQNRQSADTSGAGAAHQRSERHLNHHEHTKHNRPCC